MACFKTEIYDVTVDLFWKIGVSYRYFAGTAVQYFKLYVWVIRTEKSNFSRVERTASQVGKIAVFTLEN